MDILEVLIMSTAQLGEILMYYKSKNEHTSPRGNLDVLQVIIMIIPHPGEILMYYKS